jgi:hypothetical protein
LYNLSFSGTANNVCQCLIHLFFSLFVLNEKKKKGWAFFTHDHVYTCQLCRGDERSGHFWDMVKLKCA